jgi:hypothetical protein
LHYTGSKDPLLLNEVPYDLLELPEHNDSVHVFSPKDMSDVLHLSVRDDVLAHSKSLNKEAVQVFRSQISLLILFPLLSLIPLEIRSYGQREPF